MSEPALSISIYRATTGDWLRLVHPHGLVPPPVISMHRPLDGPVEFVYEAHEESR